jgi:hypothetical protein
MDQGRLAISTELSAAKSHSLSASLFSGQPRHLMVREETRNPSAASAREGSGEVYRVTPGPRRPAMARRAHVKPLDALIQQPKVPRA